MGKYETKPVRRLKGEVRLVGDKSISHRAVMIGSIAEGETRIKNFANSQDCLRTVEAFRQMGIVIEINRDTVSIMGRGLRGLKKPKFGLYMGNSGTTMRLLMGILAGQPFDCTLTGDESLSCRPMSRVTHPIREMGATVEGKGDAECAPLKIRGGSLKPISYRMPVASAQVKSAILFAGLYADGTTCVIEKIKSRDHTERMLKLFGAGIRTEGLFIYIKGTSGLSAKDVQIPNDISSASFFIVGATLLEGSCISMKSVLCNPTRTGILDVLKRMGADISVSNVRESGGEPICDLEVKSSMLKGTRITSQEVPALIDEIPIIMVAAALADGRTIINGAKELRVKETDRINSMAANLVRMGADVTVEGVDTIVIKGVEKFKNAELDSFGDHRTAMSMVIAALTARYSSTIRDPECIDTSFPGFLSALEAISE